MLSVNFARAYHSTVQAKASGLIVAVQRRVVESGNGNILWTPHVWRNRRNKLLHDKAGHGSIPIREHLYVQQAVEKCAGDGCGGAAQPAQGFYAGAALGDSLEHSEVPARHACEVY